MKKVLTLALALAVVIAVFGAAAPAMAQPPLPDLIVENVYEEWDEEAGCWAIHYTVLNQGDITAEAGHYTGLCLLDGLLGEYMEPFDYHEVGVELAPGDTFEGTFCLPSLVELVWELLGSGEALSDVQREALLQNKPLEMNEEGALALTSQLQQIALDVSLIAVCADCFGDVQELGEENNCTGVELPAGIDVEKKVRNPDTGEWVERIYADVGEVVAFGCRIRNEGEGPFYGVIALDLLPDSMEFVSADPVSLLVLHLPDGTTAVAWYLNLLDDPLEPGDEPIKIGLVAEVVKPGKGVNLQIAIAEWVFMDWDTAIVFGETGVQPPLVISGTVLLAECTAVPGGVGETPPWFIPQDEFLPGEELWIYGEGFASETEYNVWIVPYNECAYVREGDVLAGLGGPGNVVTITTEADGSISPAFIYTIPLDDPDMHYCTHWEIVVDNDDGIYHELDDGLDALAYDEWGFHIYPEAMTIVLFSVGLVGLGGYYTLRRRKDTESDI